MPIIPVLNPEGPDYSPPRMATPSADMMPAAQRAKLAGQGVQLLLAGQDFEQSYYDTQGQITAQKARVKYAYDVESAKKELLDAPLKPLPGAESVTGDQGGEEGWGYESLGYQP